METNILVREPAFGIRALARETLRGNWLKGFLATIIYAIVLCVPPIILLAVFGATIGESVGNLYTLLVWGPFAYGYTLFCVSIFRAKEARLEQIFYGFENFGKALVIMVLIEIFTFLWSLLFVIPGIIAGYRYSQAFYIMVDHPELSAMQCIAASKYMMIGNKYKLFCLQFSFIGWSILASIPLGIYSNFALPDNFMSSLLGIAFAIPILLVVLYMSIAQTAFYDIASGNLRPGVIESTAEVFDEEKDAGF